MNTETTTGTSLEVLAPYLPYGITVEWHGHTGVRFAGVLAGLNQHIARVKGFKYGVDFASCLPVLRPFWALCDPLPDGFTPALVVAAYLVNDWACTYRFVARPSSLDTVHVDVFEQAGHLDEDEVQVYVVNLYADWDWDVLRFDEEGEYPEGCHNPTDVIDYLRRNHFAVNLDSAQYIAK